MYPIKNINNTIVNGKHGKPILLDICYKQTNTPKPIIVFVHGFKGFKDWGHFNLIANKFAENNFVFAKFNFSHNGTTIENPCEFGDLEAFGNNNYLKELDDLESVLNHLTSNKLISNQADTKNIYLIGHSRGGGIAILKAAEDLRVKKLVTWASVSDFIHRNKANTIMHWEKDGVVHTFNQRTQQNMPLYYQFYETIIKNKEKLNIKKAAQKLKIPFLIIHGTNDEAVKLTDAKELKNANINAELLIIENAGHTFGVKHPFELDALPPDSQTVFENTLRFFKEDL